MRLKITSTLFCVALCFKLLNAGVVPVTSLYPYSTLWYNPAYTGYHEKNALAVLGRAQWIGLEGAPNTAVISYDKYLAKRNWGMGAVYMYDEISFTKTNSLGWIYMYRLKLKESVDIRLGHQISVINKMTDYSKYEPFGPDPAIPTGKFSDTKIDVDLGMWFNAKDFYFGFSISNFLEQKFKHDNVILKNYTRMHITSGYFFRVGDYVTIHPSLRYMYMEYTDLLDINTTFIFNDLFHFGISYRGIVHENSNPLVLILGSTIKEKYEIMMSYDISTTDEFPGTIETVLRYKFGE
ncbi:MAG: PorP/SprF family type IX secretion system membrane protein [Flavobacteriales bacterium]|nr:PorP/SprF family type IX secretion system membrane protein [Flavobacteriales bacterium]